MVAHKLKNFFLRFRKKSLLDLYVEKNSVLEYQDDSIKYFTGSLKIANESKLIVGKNVKFHANLRLGTNSVVYIGDNCIFQNTSIFISNNSEVNIGEGTVISPPKEFSTIIQIDDGKLFLEGYNNIMSHILVRFGGKMKVGKYTGIGYNSEIRCEESITIGSYGLFSYDVCIYDTDTHSTDWQKRRERIVAGYPYGTSEVEKPNTKPVIIGDDVWLGKGATIVKGTQIGNRCVVGIRTVASGIYDDDTTIVSHKPRIIKRYG